MEVKYIEDFIGGWFVGDFEPSIKKNEHLECAVKRYSAGDKEKAHYHAIATEITVIISGTVEMCGNIYSQGNIIVLEPNDISSFYAVTDAVTVVVKTPSVIGDKYIIS